jgi:protein-S-isoprenylcysteine O-methyltransferase Ste14
LVGEAIVGIRAANISMRGIITTGPFAFTRHPIYVSKCFQWALLYFPVLNAVGVVNPIQSGILFLLVCAIYVGRALGEERLLSTDANYVKYALYMDNHSMFAWVGRRFPIMSYKWRYDYWTKNNMLQN